MFNRCVVLTALTVLLALSIPGTAEAQQRLFQGSLVTPVQIFPENYTIAGVRISLFYGRQASVTGLDLGMVNHTTTGMTKGVQWGLVGLAEADFTGWQGNFVNITQGNFEGLQWGVVNHANHASGLQLGLVNYAVTLNGIQIGLVNIIKQGGQFPVFPIVNWSL